MHLQLQTSLIHVLCKSFTRLVGLVDDELKERRVSFVVNRNINFTNSVLMLVRLTSMLTDSRDLFLVVFVDTKINSVTM